MCGGSNDRPPDGGEALGTQHEAISPRFKNVHIELKDVLPKEQMFLEEP